MAFLLLIPTILCYLLMAAHFLRAMDFFLIALCLIMPFMLFVRTRYVLRATQLLLLLMAIEWTFTAITTLQDRLATHNPDLIPPAIILGSVAAFNLLAAALFQTPRLKSLYPRESDLPAAPPTPQPD